MGLWPHLLYLQTITPPSLLWFHNKGPALHIHEGAFIVKSWINQITMVTQTIWQLSTVVVWWMFNFCKWPEEEMILNKAVHWKEFGDRIRILKRGDKISIQSIKESTCHKIRQYFLHWDIWWKMIRVFTLWWKISRRVYIREYIAIYIITANASNYTVI